MAYQDILFDVKDRIATLTLNRPNEMNAMTDAMFVEVKDALARLPDTDARVLILTGAGRGFCSGASLAGDGGLDDVEASVRGGLNVVIEAFYALDIPVITAVNGAAAGAGCPLALVGDVVIAARSAFFIQAFTNVGLIPDGGSSWLLPRQIGRARAMRMMMLAEKVSAETAESWGMISFVADDEVLLDKARDIATRFANGPTQSYKMIRQAVRAGFDSNFADTLSLEAVNQGIASRTEDFKEGATAFREKRKPHFTGK